MNKQSKKCYHVIKIGILDGNENKMLQLEERKLRKIR